MDPAGRHRLAAPRANQLQPRLLPPYPQLQLLTLLVNLLLINPVSRPSQNPRPVMFSHPLRLAKDPSLRKLPFRLGSRIPAQSRIFEAAPFSPNIHDAEHEWLIKHGSHPPRIRT